MARPRLHGAGHARHGRGLRARAGAGHRARRTSTPGCATADARRRAPGKLRAMLVAAEIAIALVLVVGAALLIRTLVALQRVDMGFNGDRVLTASIAPPRAQYRDLAALRATLPAPGRSRPPSPASVRRR